MINEVRDATNSFLNKNNYGNIPISDFTNFCRLAQIDIYNDNLTALNEGQNQEIRNKAGHGYAEQVERANERLELFYSNDELTQDGLTNEFFLPSLTTTNTTWRRIDSIAIYDNDGNFVDNADKVSNRQIESLRSSLDNCPSTTFYVYGHRADKVVIFPEDVNTEHTVKCGYLRMPKDPKWTYTTIGNGEPLFDPTQPDYQDFEIHESHFDDLVIKVLKYSGLNIRDKMPLAFAKREEMDEEAIKLVDNRRQTTYRG